MYLLLMLFRYLRHNCGCESGDTTELNKVLYALQTFAI